MDNQTPPRDDDPSDMTDFEKNVASEERDQLEDQPEPSDKSRFEEDGSGRRVSPEDVRRSPRP